MDSLIDQVVEQLKSLPHEIQIRVYEFTGALAASPPAWSIRPALAKIRGNNSCG